MWAGMVNPSNQPQEMKHNGLVNARVHGLANTPKANDSFYIFTGLRKRREAYETDTLCTPQSP